jgi:glycosyltransferase involved in cell wall biosynthesis
MTSDVIWADYPTARLAGLLVLIVLYIYRKDLILRIRDLPIEQRKDICKKDRSPIFNLQLRMIEKMLVWKANIIILSGPGFINHINPRTSNIINFPTGVCKDQLVNGAKSKTESNKYILAYAGSLDRSGMIEQLSSIFSEIYGWEFWIAGEGNETIDENENTKYFGLLSYLEVQKFYENADAIIIPYPNKEYYKICIPLKIGEVLATCKPIIMLKLPSIEKYLKFVGLENNVIYVNDWSKEELEKALQRAKSIDINIEHTINKLKDINWEDRTKKLLIEIDSKSSEDLQSIDSQLRWI